MQPDIPNSFLKLLSEGLDSVEEDRKLRLFAVDSYVSLLQGEPDKLPQCFLQVISWVLGEYSYLRAELQPASVLTLLARVLHMRHSSSETKTWVLLAMTKLCEGGEAPRVAQQLSETYSSSMDTVLRQRAHELQHLSSHPPLGVQMLRPAAGLEHPEVDSSLSFLDGFVSEALAAGSAPYKPPHQRQEELARAKALSLEPYSLPLPISLTDRQSPTLLSTSSGLSGDSTDLSHKGGSATLKLDKVKRVWGREGYLAEGEPAEESAQVEVPSPVRSPSQQEETGSSHIQTPTPAPEPEKQQLASSLFVGLSCQSSESLMGKGEPTPQRLRRKTKGQSSSSQPAVPASPQVENLLCGHLLDSNIHLEVSMSQKKLISQRCEDAKWDQRELKGSEPITVNGVGAADSLTYEYPDRSPDLFLSSYLPADCAEFSCSEILPLCSNQILSVSACHVQKENTLVLVVFIANSGDSDIQQFLLKLDSEELEVAHVCDSRVEAVTCQSVEVCPYILSVRRPSVHVEVVGIVSFHELDETPQTLHFSYKLPLTAFVRPLPVSTEDYGTMWLAFSNDTKQNLTLVDQAPEPLAATLDLLKEKLHLHIVEIIGNEGIASCQLLGGQPCLVHCRLHAGLLAVWLRSPASQLPDCLLYHCQRALQEL